MIAAAGSGKTTFLVNRACKALDESVIITTLTEANEKEIRDRIVSKKGYMPTNITVDVTDDGGGTAISATYSHADGTMTLTFPAGSTNVTKQTTNHRALACTDDEINDMCNL